MQYVLFRLLYKTVSPPYADKTVSPPYADTYALLLGYIVLKTEDSIKESSGTPLTHNQQQINLAKEIPAMKIGI